MLDADDFANFFAEVHGPRPFPWQGRLLRRVAESGEWPAVLDLPTGVGKTAAIDIAVFHLALEADRGAARRAPVRIAFVVDRRLVVDDAYTRARALEAALLAPTGPVTQRVAARLARLAGEREAQPLIVRRLRGGIPREDDWARTPSQPTVLCSTVDQVGSRLLFRGYGVSDSMKPVHAGLIGSDCLILLDEAHLAEPFRQTLDWVRVYRGPHWRHVDDAAPWAFALLTATPGEGSESDFTLADEDRAHPVLQRRLSAAKPARLVTVRKSTAGATGEPTADQPDDQIDDGISEIAARTAAILDEIRAALGHFGDARHGARAPAIGVVVNRVARARAVYDQLKETIDPDAADLILLIGPCRPVDRDAIAGRLAPIRTGAKRTLERPLILIATQCIEAGVDIDLDGLVAEAAPLDCLRQRFGRLNRAGREVKPFAAVVVAKSDLSPRVDDPVYGRAIGPAWDSMTAVAIKHGSHLIVDFGIDASTMGMPPETLSPRSSAPILLPAHLDLLSQTSPVPAADPEVSLYLHGSDRQPDSVSVIWRADIDPTENADEDHLRLRRLFTLVSPRPLEAIELPIWAVRRWLSGDFAAFDRLADIAIADADDDQRARPDAATRRMVFRWKGDDERSRWIGPTDIRPGDTIIVPVCHGGLDEFGWNPGRKEPARDIGRMAAEPFAGRRLAVRVAPGLFGGADVDEALVDALAGAHTSEWRELRAAVLALAQGLMEKLPRADDDTSAIASMRERLSELHEDLTELDRANRGRVVVYQDLYGTDDDRPRGVVFVAPFGIKGQKEDEDGHPNATEDDVSGSTPGFALSLEEHSRDVERKADDFAAALGLPSPRRADMKLAGFLHDAGKADPRFQAWLQYSDPLGPDPNGVSLVLAKSPRPLPRTARAGSGLPERWRHEALSVRLAPLVSRFSRANDPELVLWLVGVHHGYGRPLFPHRDCDDEQTRGLPDALGLPRTLPPRPGPQSLAFDWNGLDWPTLFAQLKARYGIWELARLEAILRLADHRASEDARLASVAPGATSR